MKIDSSNGKEVDLGYKTYKFKIGEQFQAKAMWALINLYKDKIGTPVKEVISNGRDANRENGKCDSDLDIELTKLHFSVRDYGKGMSPQLVEEVVTNFGASTKTGNNLSTGGFGIGFKSPLCRVNQFKVATWIDGIEYNYIVAKNGDNLELNLISQNSSDKPSGTKVTLPMIDTYNNEEYNKYLLAIKKVIMFWDKLPRTNFNVPKIESLKLDDNCYRVANGNYAKVLGIKPYQYYYGDTLILVIDGLPYEIESQNFTDRRINEGSTAVIKFNTGEIKIHETRERIEPTDQQKLLIQNRLSDVINYDYKNNIIKNVNDYVKLGNYYKSLAYKVSDELSFNRGSAFFDLRNYEYKGYRKNKVSFNSTVKYIPLNREIFYVDNNESLTKYSRRIIKYCNDNFCSAYVTTIKNEILEKVLLFKNVSELPMPEMTSKGKLLSSTINALVCKGVYTSQISIPKSNISCKQYLVLDYTAIHDHTMVSFANSLGYILIKLSKDNQDFVKSLSNFTLYDKFIDTFEVTQKMSNKVLFSKINRDLIARGNITNINHLSTHLGFLDVNNDCEIVEFLKATNLLNSYNDSKCELPKSLGDKILEERKDELNNLTVKITQLQKSIEKRFPLIYNAMGNDNVLNTYLNAMISYEKKGVN